MAYSTFILEHQYDIQRKHAPGLKIKKIDYSSLQQQQSGMQKFNGVQSQLIKQQVLHKSPTQKNLKTNHLSPLQKCPSNYFKANPNNFQKRNLEIDIQLQEEEENQQQLLRKNLNQKLRNLRFYTYIMNDSRWKPDSRENHTLVNNNGTLFLYGGIGCEIYKEVSALNTENWQWFDLNQDGDQPSEGRQGHSLVCYKNQLVLFGGERKYNKNVRIRECFSDCRIFNLNTRQWTLVRQFGDFLESRRNHTACLVGKFLIIIGGVDSNGKYLNDVCSVNLETSKSIHLDQIDGYADGIAFSACCSVFKNETKIENLYLPFEKAQAKQNKGINQSYLQGIYVFGGRQENGDALNNLRVLQLGRKPLKWIDLEFTGQQPEGRFSHTLSYYKEFNSLILVGGRNEVYYSKQGSNIFQDIYMFSLEFSEWIKIDMRGGEYQARCSHSAAIIDTKIIIFGGISHQGICSSDLLVIELDQKKCQSFLKEHNQRIQEIDNKNQKNSMQLKHQFSIDGIISNENYIFQVPSSCRQNKYLTVKNKISSNRNQLNFKSEYFPDNNNQQYENTKEHEHQQAIIQSRHNLNHHINNHQNSNTNDRVHAKFEKCKTFLPLPLVPKRNTLLFGNLTYESQKRLSIQKIFQDKKLTQNVQKVDQKSNLSESSKISSNISFGQDI
ncbi:kelch motif protein (macronuclear) [Tetrahymena thermophila SB210]|uniref:Kelch motif protein n=1 Tax=Tetrahymena thermophila (strain SB210) TaxID=312017 RepID=Q22GZ7_TETTS|nr:kelch motif protein [Tetrahymena thermophila SB210]EAR84527.1 kelch motif protein [Tetrahymena thermophila SB210]|eukprot:XP_001032190.1 kelch motif protein [Tetrahymena thermophila SB210]